MKNKFTSFFAFLVVFLQISANTFALPNNQILIRFKETSKETEINKFITDFKLKKLKILSGINLYVLEVPTNMKPAQAIKKLEKISMVKYVEENKQIELNTNLVEPSEKVNYAKMLGKEITITGLYEANRAGAMFSNDNGTISLIDLDNRVLLKLPNIQEGSNLKLTGIVRKIKGYNVTNDIGLLVTNVEEIKK